MAPHKVFLQEPDGPHVSGELARGPVAAAGFPMSPTPLQAALQAVPQAVARAAR